MSQDSTADSLFIKTEPICQEANGASQATAAESLFDMDHSYVLQSGAAWQHQDLEELMDGSSPEAVDQLVTKTKPSSLGDSTADSSTAASGVLKKRGPRLSPAQVRALKVYMALHPKLAKGKLFGPHSKEEQAAQWARLASALNAIGPSKSVDRWRTSWRDVKCAARRKSAQGQTDNAFEERSLKEVLATEGLTLYASGQTCEEGLPLMPSPAGSLLEPASWTNDLEEFIQHEHTNEALEVLRSPTLATVPPTSSSSVATLPSVSSIVVTLPSISSSREATSAGGTLPSTSSSTVATSTLETLPSTSSAGLAAAGRGATTSTVTGSSSTASRSNMPAKIWTVQEMVQNSMAANTATQATLNCISTDVAWLRLAMAQILEASKQQAAASERQAAALERLAAANESWSTFLIEHSRKS